LQSIAAAGLLLAVVLAPPGRAAAQDLSLRFYGHGTGDVDRVKIPLDAPARPVDVAGDFTLEWWMSALLSDNASPACTPGNDNWITGNVVFDRDVFGAGDLGDYGVSLRGGRVAFGVHNGTAGDGICGTSNVADGAWHHVAVTRAASGEMRIFVDGQLEAQLTAGPAGDVSYADGRTTAYPASDPFLVIGAEKHDAGAAFPSYDGFLDEVRLSNVVRYAVSFTRPGAPFASDASTVALYHFDEGPLGPCTGTVLDSSGASGGPSDGLCRYGGVAPAGPVYSANTPFAAPTPVPAVGGVGGATLLLLFLTIGVAASCRRQAASAIGSRDRSRPSRLARSCSGESFRNSQTFSNENGCERSSDDTQR
jgi:hypothetical protein